jgi:hypothetical protein
LGDALDAQMQLTREQMGRHAAEQSLVWQRQTAQDRIALLTKEAAYHHNDADLVDGMGHAAANAARAHSRVGNTSLDPAVEAAAAATARSSVLSSAIQAKVDAGDLAGGTALLDRSIGQLDPAHAAPLQASLDALRRADAAKTYASQFVSALPAKSSAEIEGQRTAALDRAAVDHASDPRQQALASQFIDASFNQRQADLAKETAERAAAVRDWLNTPDANGKPQTSLPPAALWNRLTEEERNQLLVQLHENGSPSDSSQPWENLGTAEKFKAAFQRFSAEGDARGAAFAADSAARHLQAIDELTRRQNAGEELNVTEKRFLLKNRHAAMDLAGSVGRLVDAQRRIADLPRSAALRQLYEAATAVDAARIIAAHPGEIAKAFGVESVPDLLVQMAAVGAMGPLAAGTTLTGTSGLQGYASGLIGALAQHGVDIGDPERLSAALHDKELMERVRFDATRDGVIAAGTTLAMAAIGGRKSSRGSISPQSSASGEIGTKASESVAAKLTPAEQLAANKAAGKAFEETKSLELQQSLLLHAPQVTVETPSGTRVRLDFMTQDPGTGEVRCIECKASPTARLSPNQKSAFPEIEKAGATVKGNAGEPYFPDGTKFPPGKVDIHRKK